jgi:hypothetical protein
MVTRRAGVTVDRLQAENDFLRRGGIAEEIGKTVRVLLVCGALVAIVYLLGHALEALAGKETDANIFVNLLGKLEASVILSWVVGGAGVVYGRSQMKLRKTTIERLQSRLKSLEEQLDPHRTSSKLTPRGDTNPEDA